MGRFGSPSPARDRRTASATAVHRVVLADDPLVQVLLKPEQPFPLLLGELRDRDPGGAGDHLRDVGRGDLGHRLAAPPCRPAPSSASAARWLSSAIWSRSVPARW